MEMSKRDIVRSYQSADDDMKSVQIETLAELNDVDPSEIIKVLETETGVKIPYKRTSAWRHAHPPNEEPETPYPTRAVRLFNEGQEPPPPLPEVHGTLETNIRYRDVAMDDINIALIRREAIPLESVMAYNHFAKYVNERLRKESE